LPKRRVKSVSKNDDRGANRFEAFSVSALFPVDKSNRVSRPATVGKKKGARSAAFGASLGLFRCYLSAFALGEQ
jgi:hypothetical protein